MTTHFEIVGLRSPILVNVGNVSSAKIANFRKQLYVSA
jgi:hypothetical protein